MEIVIKNKINNRYFSYLITFIFTYSLELPRNPRRRLKIKRCRDYLN